MVVISNVALIGLFVLGMIVGAGVIIGAYFTFYKVLIKLYVMRLKRMGFDTQSISWATKAAFSELEDEFYEEIQSEEA